MADGRDHAARVLMQPLLRRRAVLPHQVKRRLNRAELRHVLLASDGVRVRAARQHVQRLKGNQVERWRV